MKSKMYNDFYFTEHVAPGYSVVEIQDVVNSNPDDLWQYELVTLVDHTTPKKIEPRYDPRRPERKYDSKPVKPSFIGALPAIFPIKEKVFNPIDNAVVCSKDFFRILFASDSYSLDCDAWQVFASDSVACFYEKTVKKTKIDKRNRQPCFDQITIQQFRIQLRMDSPFGYIQFIQKSKRGIENQRGFFPYEYILTLYISGATLEATKGLISTKRLRPVSLNNLVVHNYVPVFLGEILQLITPQDVNVEISPERWSVIPQDVVLSVDEQYSSHNFYCARQANRITPIYISGGAQSRNQWAIIPVIRNDASGKFIVIDAPPKEMVLHRHNTDGCILRVNAQQFAQYDKSQFIDSEKKLLVEAKSIVNEKDREIHELKIRYLHTWQKIYLCDLFSDDSPTP